MLKRIFDIIFSFLGMILLLPFFVIICLSIIVNSGLPLFYFQERVGKNSRTFKLIKFRTMRANSDKKGLLTIGGRDPRVTAIGYYLRKYKLDELPQLLNVLVGSMSLVGPRPEVSKYVNLYNAKQLQVLNVKPGITDFASLEFINENDLLAQSSNPEETYINSIMPQKLDLNLQYIAQQSFMTDIKIITHTLLKIIK